MSHAVRYTRRTLAWVPALLGIAFSASKLVEAVNGSIAPGLGTPLAGFLTAMLVVGAAFLSLAD